MPALVFTAAIVDRAPCASSETKPPDDNRPGGFRLHDTECRTIYLQHVGHILQQVSPLQQLVGQQSTQQAGHLSQHAFELQHLAGAVVGAVVGAAPNDSPPSTKSAIKIPVEISDFMINPFTFSQIRESNENGAETIRLKMPEARAARSRVSD
jgi:hypothetical protein